MSQPPPERFRFQPGQSGNPGGRSQGKTVARYVRECTGDGKELVDILLAIARDKRVKRAQRIRAVAELFDRGWGTAPQTINVTVNDQREGDIDWDGMSDEELDRMIAAEDDAGQPVH